MEIESIAGQDITWCEICREHRTGQCDGCHKEFEDEPKYRSSSHHFHPGAVNGLPAMMGINKTLCTECYREDFAKMYPDIEVPV